MTPALGGGAPALRRTRLVSFCSPCAAAGTAAAVAAAATATPRPRNFRRLVVLILILPVVRMLSPATAAAGAILMPLRRPLRFAILAERDGARHLAAFRLPCKLVRHARALGPVTALETDRVRGHRPIEIARREFAVVRSHQLSTVLFQNERVVHRPTH